MKVIKIVFFLLVSASLANAQVSVFAKVDHIKPDGIDTVGSIALTVSGSTAPYTYTWNPGAINTKDITNKTAGQYTVNVKSASSQTYTNAYKIGYKVQWQKHFTTTFRNDSLTTTYPQANAWSKNTLAASTDGWFEYVINSITSGTHLVGFLDSISPAVVSTDIDYGVIFEGVGQDLYAIQTGTTNVRIKADAKVGDVVRVERVGNVIKYFVNNTAARTVTVSGVSSKVFKLKTFFSTNTKLTDIGCSFTGFSNQTFPNYVALNPYIKHSSDYGIGDGLAKVTPRVPFSNTYTWSPGGATTNSVTSLGYGTNKVTVTDSLSNASSHYYNVGYKVKWTNLDLCSVIGDSLVSSATSNFISTASCKNTLRGGEDGWVEFPIDKLSGQTYYIGFSDSLSPLMGSTRDIDYGINFVSTNNFLYCYESGTTSILCNTPCVGDLVKIERVGDIIYYKVNNAVLRKVTVSGLSSKSLKIKTAIQNADYLGRVGCSFYDTDSTDFKNYLQVNRTVKHSSQVGLNDGSAIVASKASGAYTYTWLPGEAHTSTVLFPKNGTYSVTIKDSVANTSTYDCNVGYKAKWTNLSQCFFRNDTIKGTGPNNTYTGNAYSSNILSSGANGWIEFVLKAYPSNATYLGFTDSTSTGVTSLTEMAYGFLVPASSRVLYYYESGTSNPLFSYMRTGDVIRIERSGNNILYKVNGVVLRTVTSGTLSTRVMKAKVRLQYNNELVNVGCSFIQDKLNGSVAKEHSDYDNSASGIIAVSGTGGLAPYRYSWTEFSDSSNVHTELVPGTYHVRITDARNDTVTIPVTIGYKNNWRLQKDISFAGNTYLNTRALSDSAGTLVSANTILANKDGWTELTVNDSTKNTTFGFLGFTGTDLDTSYSASYVKDAAISSALVFADSLVYKRFATSSTQVSSAFANLHLVGFKNGIVKIGFKGYSSTSSIYYVPGDVFRMQRTGNYISLYKNNVSIATETVSSASQQLLTALFVTGGHSECVSMGGNTSDTTVSYATSGNRTMAPCDDSGLNWVYSKNFDENGVVKSESKVYMDLLGRTLQTQSKLISANNVLVSEPMYDSFGRAVGQTLPAPVFKTDLCYTPYFMFVKEDTAYTADYFDNVPGVHAGGLINTGTDSYNQPGDVNNPVPVYADAFGSLGWYYSDNNYEETLVAADAYPYTRVDFYNDPMGRTKRSGGVGEHHKMGTGHESKIIYTSTPANTADPVQNELNFIFPHRTYELEKDFSVNTTVLADINKNLQLYKTITLNADGKDQIIYTNSAGQTIATCMTGDGTGCVSHTQLHELYNGTTKTPKKIYIPKSGNASLKLYELTGTTKSYSNITPVLKDAFTGITLLSTVHYSYNSSTGVITFLGDYLDKSLYLDISYSISHTYHFPANTTVNATVDVDYTQWSAYFYDRKGRLLANVAPKDITCQTVPYSVQKTIAAPSRIVQSLKANTSPASRMIAQPSTDLSFELNTAALADTNKVAVLNLGFMADTVFTMTVDTGIFALFAQGPGRYDDSVYVAAHPYELTYADTIYPPALDSNMLFSNVLDTSLIRIENGAEDLSYDYYRRADSVYKLSPKLSVLGKTISYAGYFTVKAWSSDSVSVNLGDSIPFTFDVEAAEYDTLSGGVVCRVTGYQHYGPGSDPRALPGILLPDLPPDTHTITVIPTFTVTVKDNNNHYVMPDGTGGVKDPPTTSDPGAGVLAAGTTITGGILVVPYVPTPIPVSFAHTYMYDEFDRLIGSDSEDEGHVDYVYDQKEDKLLFTQNDKQRANGGKFNCLVYDALGRMTQSGEYDATAGSYQFQTYDQYYRHPVSPASGKTSVGTPALNNTSGYNDGHILDATHVAYDDADASLPTALSNASFTQKYTAAKVTKTWNDNTTTWYGYDELGRMLFSVNNSSELGYKTMINLYDFRGKLNATIYQYQQSDQLIQGYTYDADERLVKSRYSTSFSNFLSNITNPTAEYSYYLHGPLKRAVLGDKLQGLDFVYTIGGMLKSVNNPIGTTTLDDPGLDGYAYGPNLTVNPDVFGFSLQYYDGDYVRTGSPIRSNAYTGAFGSSNVSYAGLVRNTIWRTTLPAAAPASYTNALMYEYKYDDLGQLTDAQFGTVTQGIGATQSFTQRGEYKTDNISYDKNGNIQSLRRYAETVPGTSIVNLLDDLTYNYHSSKKNRLLKVADASANPGGYSAEYDMPNQTNSNNYVYNEIGELIENKQEDQGFEYNASGLTTRVYKLSNNHSIATFTYNDKGLRHSKTSYNSSGVAVKATYYSYDAGGAQVAAYTKDLVTGGATVQLQNHTLYGAGRLGSLDAASGKELYELSDHLGNVRAIVAKNNSTNLAEVLSYTDYYPHGGVLPGRNYQNTLGVPYSYQGIEKDPETNLLNFELRQFDVRLGRWQGPDPMGEFHSPYLAMGNNPVSTTDPTGGYTSDQFWNSTDAPRIGAYSDLNIGVEDRRDGAQINEMPVADPDKHSYLFMTPKERRNVQAMNGTSYEHQALNIMIEMVNAFGSYTSQGKTFMYSQKRQQYGYWQDWSSTSGAVMVYKQGTEDGKMSVSTTGRFTVGSVWNNSGVNGSLHRYLWAQKTYGGQGDGSFMDDVLYTVSTFNSRWNPIAHLMDAMNGVYRSTDRFGNKQSGWETTVKGTSGILFMFGGAIADAYVGVATAPQTFEEIAMNPGALWGKSQDEVGAMLGDGWKAGTYGSNKMGWKFIKGDKSVFYNASSSAHGGAEYYGFSSTFIGKVKIIDPSTYLPRLGDKATIFYRPVSPFN